MASDDQHTPARRQYLTLKQRHPDALLLYRMGDFYELFDDDAAIASRDLHITLTSREFGKGKRVPMAGIPHHALASYLRRLLAKGHRVAICEQLSESGRGLVERDVVRVLSPGTIAEPGLLAARENNYLVALNPGRDGAGLAYVDVTTGEFGVTQFGPHEDSALAAELARLAPAECLAPEDRAARVRPPAPVASPSPPGRAGTHPASATEVAVAEGGGGGAQPPPSGDPTLPAALACPVTLCPARWFAEEPARDRLLRHFGVVSLEPFGCDALPLAIGAAAAVLAYVDGTSPELLRLLRALHTDRATDYVDLDGHTRRNLELTRTARSGERSGSLLAVLDQTRTAMGGRLLRRWLARPLRDVTAIGARLDVVGALASDHPRRAALIAALERAGDIERLAGRARQRSASPRDLLNLAAGLRAAAECVACISLDSAEDAALGRLVSRIDELRDVTALVDHAVTDEDGRVIRRGFDAELDELVATVSSAQGTLLEMERRERERTGIRSLKIGFNKVFGYYIELSRTGAKNAPADYVRRQTLANGERFVTPELKEWEARILRAEERIAAREAEVFACVVEQVGAEVGRLLATAAAVAELDVLAAFAEVAVRHRYVRPSLDHSTDLIIRQGRHPVVEQTVEEGGFVANDTHLGAADGRLLLITGPNMAGKSTYLRQVALIALLAHIGCFVPAAEARIGVVDRIFTRVGAQDDLAGGASTFLVEMVETAAILRHATARSLVVFDEVGRGTSTFDGLSIAQAVVEDVHDRIGGRTLFATHFHELTALAEHLRDVRNYNAAATEEDDRVVFLRRIVPGRADRSYGIHVARLAGLPEHVTERAATILATIEPQSAAPSGFATHDPFAVPNRALRERASAPGYDTPSVHADALHPADAAGADDTALAHAARPADEQVTRDELLPAPAAAQRAAHDEDCSFCADAARAAITAEVQGLHLAAMTPMQAMNALFDLQQRLAMPAPCSCRSASGRPRLAVVSAAALGSGRERSPERSSRGAQRPAHHRPSDGPLSVRAPRSPLIPQSPGAAAGPLS